MRYAEGEKDEEKLLLRDSAAFRQTLLVHSCVTQWTSEL
jgi:hypothetical protein